MISEEQIPQNSIGKGLFFMEFQEKLSVNDPSLTNLVFLTNLLDFSMIS